MQPSAPPLNCPHSYCMSVGTSGMRILGERVEHIEDGHVRDDPRTSVEFQVVPRLAFCHMHGSEEVCPRGEGGLRISLHCSRGFCSARAAATAGPSKAHTGSSR